jgi:hypothetical protein
MHCRRNQTHAEDAWSEIRNDATARVGGADTWQGIPGCKKKARRSGPSVRACTGGLAGALAAGSRAGRLIGSGRNEKGAGPPGMRLRFSQTKARNRHRRPPPCRSRPRASRKAQPWHESWQGDRMSGGCPERQASQDAPISRSSPTQAQVFPQPPLSGYRADEVKALRPAGSWPGVQN